MTAQSMRSVSSIVSYEDANDGIRLLVGVFGFEEVAVMRGDDGRVLHSELRWGDDVVMVADRGEDSPYTPGPTCLFLTLEDPDAHHAKSVEAGLEVVMPLTDQDYGSREYAVRDTGGNVWVFGTYAPGGS